MVTTAWRGGVDVRDAAVAGIDVGAKIVLRYAGRRLDSQNVLGWQGRAALVPAADRGLRHPQKASERRLRTYFKDRLVQSLRVHRGRRHWRTYKHAYT